MSQAFEGQLSESLLSKDPHGTISAGFGAQLEQFQERVASAGIVLRDCKVISVEQILVLGLRLKPEEVETAKKLITDALAENANISSEHDPHNGPCEALLNAANKLLENPGQGI